ncbi:MAG: hypothetical protein ACREAU_04840 [Nitrosopumilaceae archaeon]
MTDKKKTPALSKKSTEIEQYWREYSAALVRWKLAYEVWHKAGSEAIKKYNFAIENTIGPENFSKTLGQNWEKAWMESGLEQIKKFGDEWQHMLKASGLESIHKFNEDWQKFWTKPGLDPSATYFESIKQFSKVWQDMWKK